MADLADKEKKRLVEQAHLDSLKSAGRRNQLGQFATPPSLAEEILRYARALTGSARFLDPAIGTGSFYSALRRVFETERIQEATGIELDPGFAQVARNIWSDTGLEVVEADFTALTPAARYNLLISNPPYVRHHHLDAATKERLQALVWGQQRIRVSGLAGLYCYFLLLSDGWLTDGALSMWLIPSEFMDVNYGFAVKRYLTDRVQLLHIHRFCPQDVQFADALVSSSIVVFRKGPPSEGNAVRISLGGSLLDPSSASLVSLDLLRQSRKWTTCLTARHSRNQTMMAFLLS